MLQDTFVFLKLLDQAVALLNYSGFADPLAHPKVPQRGQGKAPHLFPGLTVVE